MKSSSQSCRRSAPRNQRTGHNGECPGPAGRREALEEWFAELLETRAFDGEWTPAGHGWAHGVL